MKTLLELKNSIYSHFKENNQLILPDDFHKIVIISENKELDLELIKVSLETFIVAGLTKKVEFSVGSGRNKIDKIAYVLEKPLYAWTQNIEIPGDLSSIISDTINSQKDKDDTNLSDPTKLSYLDIQGLLVILNFQSKAIEEFRNEIIRMTDEQ